MNGDEPPVKRPTLSNHLSVGEWDGLGTCYFPTPQCPPPSVKREEVSTDSKKEGACKTECGSTGLTSQKETLHHGLERCKQGNLLGLAEHWIPRRGHSRPHIWPSCMNMSHTLPRPEEWPKWGFWSYRAKDPKAKCPIRSCPCKVLSSCCYLFSFPLISK